MFQFLKKSRAAFCDLHANPKDFMTAFIIAILYSVIMMITIRSANAFGILFNTLLFTFLGAGVKQSNSLFHSLSLTQKEKVDLTYTTFCFWLIFVFLLKGIYACMWKIAITQFAGLNFIDSFYFDEPIMLVFYAVWLYGLFISIGFEFMLFPILFIDEKRKKVNYFIKAAFISILPTLLFNTIGFFLCRKQEDYKYNAWFSSDSFAVFPMNVLVFLIIYAGIFMVTAVAASIKIAEKHYNKSMKERKYTISTESEIYGRKKKLYIRGIIIVTISMILLGVVFLFSALKREINEVRRLKVAGTQLTEDTVFGPMVLKGEVYFPTQEELKFEDKKEAGSFTYKGEDTTGLFYSLFIHNIAYLDHADADNTYCIVEGADLYSYVKADYMEENFKSDQYKKIVMFDPDWLEQQAWSKNGSRAGIHDADYTILQNLEELFGAVTYRAVDFESVDSYFAVVAVKGEYKKTEWLSEADYYLNDSDVVGCILVKDEKYYYGNYENLIPDNLANEIKNSLSE